MSRGTQRIKPPVRAPERGEAWTPPARSEEPTPAPTGPPEGSMLDVLLKMNAIKRRSLAVGRARRFSDC